MGEAVAALMGLGVAEVVVSFDTIEKDDRWTVAELQGEMHKLGG